MRFDRRKQPDQDLSLSQLLKSVCVRHYVGRISQTRENAILLKCLYLQSRLPLRLALHPSKPLEILNHLRIRHRRRWHDLLPTQHLLDRDLDFFPINRDRYVGHLQHKLGHMSGRQPLPDSLLDLVSQLRGQGVAWLHDEEQEDFFVGVLGAAAPDAEAVADDGVEGAGFDDGVDFAGAEADPGWVCDGEGG